MAINQANNAPLTRDPEARARYGGLDALAPDGERRPVSINAVAASLGLPFETVRRRIRRLAAEQVCVAVGRGRGGAGQLPGLAQLSAVGDAGGTSACAASTWNCDAAGPGREAAAAGLRPRQRAGRAPPPGCWPTTSCAPPKG